MSNKRPQQFREDKNLNTILLKWFKYNIQHKDEGIDITFTRIP